MNGRSRKLSEAVDTALRDEWRLAIAHVVLGGIAIFAYWLPPSAPRPPPGVRGYGVLVFFLTWRAWLPYGVSWAWARQLLIGTGHGAVTFIALATTICAGSAGFYLGLFNGAWSLSPDTIALTVTVLLIGSAFVCAMIWG